MALGAGRAPEATSSNRPAISQRTTKASRLRSQRRRPRACRQLSLGVKSRRDLIAECVESGLRKKVLISWTRKGNIDKIRDAARPRAHNGNAVGEECGFVDAVGYQQGRGTGFGPYPLQFDIHLAAENLVESAEGLVEKQDRKSVV